MVWVILKYGRIKLLEKNNVIWKVINVFLNIFLSMLHTKWILFGYKISDNYVNTVWWIRPQKLRVLFLCIMFQIEFYRWDLYTNPKCALYKNWMKLQLDTALNCALSSNIPIVLLIYWYNQWSFAFCFRVMLIEKEHTLLCLSTLIFIIMWTLPKINWKDCGVVSKHLIQNFNSVILVVGKTKNLQ